MRGEVLFREVDVKYLTLVCAGLRFAESFIKFPGGLGVTCLRINCTTGDHFE